MPSERSRGTCSMTSFGPSARSERPPRRPPPTPSTKVSMHHRDRSANARRDTRGESLGASRPTPDDLKIATRGACRRTSSEQSRVTSRHPREPLQRGAGHRLDDLANALHEVLTAPPATSTEASDTPWHHLGERSSRPSAAGSLRTSPGAAQGSLLGVGEGRGAPVRGLAAGAVEGFGRGRGLVAGTIEGRADALRATRPGFVRGVVRACRGRHCGRVAGAIAGVSRAPLRACRARR
jgi:hypothetical protein